MADLKKSQAEKIKEDRKETTKTQHGSATSTYDNDGKRKSVVHKDERKYSDEEHGEVASNVKSKSAADKKKEAPAQKFSPKGAKTWGMKNSEKFDNRDKAIDENMEPCEHCGGAGHVPKAPVKVHPDHAGKVAKYNTMMKATHAAHKRMDANKNGIPDEDEGLAEAADEKCNHSAKGKKCPVHGLKECGMYEDAKWHDAKPGANPIIDIATRASQDQGMLDSYIRNLYDYIDRNNMENDPKWKQAEQMASDYHFDWSKKNGYPSANTEPELARKGEKLRHRALVNAVLKVFGHHVSSLKGSIKSAHGTHTEPNLPEGAKPSAGLSKAKKSAVVKDAKAGKDIGKPGKGFDKLAKSAGGGEKGKKIAAAAMWKNIKETTAYVAEKAEVEKKAKRDYDEDGKIETGKAEHAGSVDKAIKASKSKETVKESADMTRLRELTKHLLG